MAAFKKEDLLRDPQVRKEIERYKWIVSEHMGHDLGFEEAAREWIDRYADLWVKHHISKKAVKYR